MDTVRIGCVKYLNTLPLIEGLSAWRGCELVAAAPSALIGMLLGGEVDVALASVIDAVRSDGVTERRSNEARGKGVVLLPVGMIGSDGPTLTVRVFSRVPLGDITAIAADVESHTSVALFQVIIWRKYGKRVRVVEFDAEETHRGTEASRHRVPEEAEAVLLIGDKVITDAPPAAEFPHQLDLGAAWKEMTGLPFVYAVWMCREGEESSLKVRAASAMLDRARRHNAMRMDWLVASRAGERGWGREAAAEYLGSLLKYEVGEAEREAVGKFLAWAGEMGLCDAVGPKWQMANSKWQMDSQAAVTRASVATPVP